MRRTVGWAVILAVVLMVLCSGGPASAASATLAWDANQPAPTGYRLYQRVGGQSYDYTRPIWTGPGTTATVTIPDGAESYFVVRAYVTAGSRTEESGDSNEVSALTKPAPPKNLLLQAIDEIIQGMNTLKQAVAQQNTGS